MLPKSTNLIQDAEVKDHIDFIHQEAQGKPIILSTAPTAAVPLLNADEWGVYGGLLYIRKANIIYVITPSSTITVS